MQSIFRSASRRETLGKHSKGGRRDGELKILCSIPLTEYFPFPELTRESVSDSKLNATESPKLFATEKKSLGKPRQTNVDERFAWNTRIIRNAANPIDSPELGVIRKGVDGVNSFSHWPIITDSRHYPKLAVSASSTCSRK